MAEAFFAPLADRAVVAVTGPDAVHFLNGLVTNEITHLPQGSAAHAGLLSPQGKILFDFLVLRTQEGFLLDVARDKAAELIKRLGIYKLRAAVTIADVSERFDVWAAWGAATTAAKIAQSCMSFRDPRLAAMGTRILAPHTVADAVSAGPGAENASAWDYHAHRIALGVPEGGKDYDFGGAYPHEADFDLFNGVSFTKGCYVGQEVVSRMQHKTVVRKRVVRITGEGDLPPDTDVTVNGVVIGHTGTANGRQALALLRLDRYAEAMNAGNTVLTGHSPLRVRAEDFNRYIDSLAARDKV